MTTLPLAHDPAVPQLARLLDPQAMATAFGAAMGSRVMTAAPIKIKYRVGEHLRVAYRVEADGGSEVYSLRSGTGVAPGRTRRSSGGAAPPALVFQDLDACAWAFPDDRRLHDVGALFAPDDDGTTTPLDGRWVTSRLAGYAPEKSVVVACLGHEVGSSRVDLQACKLEYSIVSPK